MTAYLAHEWAAARARDAERDATTGQGVDGSRCEAVGRRDTGGAGTKRPRPTGDACGNGRARGAGGGPREVAATGETGATRGSRGGKLAGRSQKDRKRFKQQQARERQREG